MRKLLFLAILIGLVSCKKSSDKDDTLPPTNPPVTPPVTYTDNDHMLMGNPDNAVNNADSMNKYLMRKDYFALSYNNTRAIPNWVSWHLNSSYIGGVSRQDDFRPDNDLPANFYKVTENAYSGSGFDKGHNCPSGDRTNTIAANSATFLMTNMIPQAPNNNQNTWNDMEVYIRAQLGTTKEAYVIMGNYGMGGQGSGPDPVARINNRIVVPSHIWKVVVIMDNGDNDISRINENTRVIAVITPNTNTINGNWKTYRTSVDAIETATGLDLLTAVPANIQSVIEARVDNL